MNLPQIADIDFKKLTEVIQSVMQPESKSTSKPNLQRIITAIGDHLNVDVRNIYNDIISHIIVLSLDNKISRHKSKFQITDLIIEIFKVLHESNSLTYDDLIALHDANGDSPVSITIQL